MSATAIYRQLAIELFLLSLAALYLELLLIRWFTGENLVFAVFRTFPLVGSFVGLGVGIGVANDHSFRYLPHSVLLTAAIIKLTELVFFAHKRGCQKNTMPAYA